MEIVQSNRQPMTITFLPDELQVLAEIAGRIGGDGPERDFTDELGAHLKVHGYIYSHEDKIHGTISFN